jgi:transitional endoplasmic reticulum ATPase
MSVPFGQRSAPLRRLGVSDFARFALICARNVYGATDRRTPEGRALAVWVAENASQVGLNDTTLPDEDKLSNARRRGVSLPDWHKIGAALDDAHKSLQERQDTTVRRWLAALTETVGLDPLETELLLLALHYRLDHRLERLFDALAESHGGASRFCRDVGLIALLLNVSPADVDQRLTPSARLHASGLLQLRRSGDIGVLGQLTSLIRQDVAPQADFYDQLLSAISEKPLPWQAFEHLAREAELAASILRAALAAAEIGVNILLYGPPGTGKTALR